MPLQPINHRAKIHTAMSMDNGQEIINVLNMKKHMVFSNRRMPVGWLGGGGRTGRVRPATKTVPKTRAYRRGGCLGSAQQQVWRSDKEQ